MGVVVTKSRTIKMPNIRYNTYECFYNTGFWSSNKLYMRAKTNSNEYSEAIEFKDFNWDYVNREIDLIEWFYEVGISKTDLEYLRSAEFKELEKPYIGTSIKDIDTLPKNNLGILIKKHWALELRKYYNNYCQLSGRRSFHMMGDKAKWIDIGPGYSVKTAPLDYQWEWPEKYGLIK